MMSAILINLARSPDRLARMDAQLTKLGVPYQRLDACDGAQLPVAERLVWSGGQEWFDGQVGNFVSQYRAWQIIADSSFRFGLIFEDDLHVSSDTARICGDLSWIPHNADIVRLETTMQGVRVDPGINLPQFGRRLCLLKSEAWGTGAYLLERETARWLVAAPSRHHRPVDCFLFDKRLSPIAASLTTFQLSPALAIQDKFLPNNGARLNIPSLIELTQGAKSTAGIPKMIRRVARPIIGKTVVNYK